MGFINYLREYIPNLAVLSTPLRELIKDSVLYEWLPVYKKCLDAIKSAIINAPSLLPFHNKADIVLHTDVLKNVEK